MPHLVSQNQQKIPKILTKKELIKFCQHDVKITICSEKERLKEQIKHEKITDNYDNHHH